MKDDGPMLAPEDREAPKVQPNVNTLSRPKVPHGNWLGDDTAVSPNPVSAPHKVVATGENGNPARFHTRVKNVAYRKTGA